MEALERGEFDSVLRDILATAEKRELEKLAMSLASKAAKMAHTGQRDRCLRGVQSIKAALKIRFFKK